MFIRFYGYNEEVFIFGVPVKINSFSPIPEDDEELSSRTDLLGIFR